MKTLLISDLHLSEQTPEINTLFLHFLKNDARDAKALYILGDFFDAWIGDDDLSDFHLTIIRALKNLTEHNIPVYMIVGNRDFLLGKKFFAMTGIQTLPDETVIDLNGTPTLLMHGDTLCTEDKAYLRLRKIVRCTWIQKIFLLLPLKTRRKIAEKMRQKSQAYTKETAKHIMDVTQDAVMHIMKKHQVTQLIHGHTHRPAIHDLTLHDKKAQRIVLGAWHTEGSVLVCEPGKNNKLITLTV